MIKGRGRRLGQKQGRRESLVGTKMTHWQLNQKEGDIRKEGRKEREMKRPKERERERKEWTLIKGINMRERGGRDADGGGWSEGEKWRNKREINVMEFGIA